MKKILLILLFLAISFAGAYAYQQHLIAHGQLLQATAFENGDALTVVRTPTGLTLYYHDAQGYALGQAPLLLSGEPETLYVMACGQFAQVFIGYAASVPGDLNTAFVERYVWEMPRAQGCVQETMYLPIVVK